MDAIPHMRDVEIQQQPEFVTGEPEIRQQLRLVDRQDLCNALDFDEETAFDNEIDLVRGKPRRPVVCHRQPDLVLKVEARFRQPVVPGDTLMLEVTALRIGSRFQRMRGEAKVDGKLVAEAIITSAVTDRNAVQ